LLKNNNYSHQIRNNKNGISLNEILEYQSNYSLKNTKKQNISCNLNFYNNKQINRTSYYKKEKNIPFEFYEFLNTTISNLSYDFVKNINKNEKTYLAIDGTNTNDIKQNVVLNMGYYDITNDIAFDLTYSGTENRNKEVKETIKYIKKNIDYFKNTILVCDRFYFSYDFFNFLNEHNIQYIIRCKGEAKNLDKNNKLKKNKQTDFLEKIRKNTIIINYTNPIVKILKLRKNKKNEKKTITLKVLNDCVLITNIKDFNTEKLLEIYRKRWNIEVFFKILKNNFKVQHTLEKDKTQIKKIYSFALIVMNLVTVLEKHYFLLNPTKDTIIKKKTNNTKKCTIKTNKSLLIDGIFKGILPKMFKSSLTKKDIENVLNNYVSVIKNETDRHFERYSSIPFTKWYVKYYSNNAEISKIIDVIENKNIKELNKNLKSKLKKIIEVIEIKIEK
jgi:hypothetical protein